MSGKLIYLDLYLYHVCHNLTLLQQTNLFNQTHSPPIKSWWRPPTPHQRHSTTLSMVIPIHRQLAAIAQVASPQKSITALQARAGTRRSSGRSMIGFTMDCLIRIGIIVSLCAFLGWLGSETDGLDSEIWRPFAPQLDSEAWCYGGMNIAWYDLRAGAFGEFGRGRGAAYYWRFGSEWLWTSYLKSTSMQCILSLPTACNCPAL